MAEPNYRTCPAYGRALECDGITHYYAIWDEELNRHVPVDGACPHRETNRYVLARERAEDNGEPFPFAPPS